MTLALLEEYIFSKPYFDPSGLIVATKDDQPIGFAHAGFGSDETGNQLETCDGTTYCVMVDSSHADKALEEELLNQSESYLRSRGARVLYGGGISPMNAFYIGLYGGSELPGILDSDTGQQALFARSRYRTASRVVVLHCDLSRFHPPISRQARECSHRYMIASTTDPSSTSWWEACTMGSFNRIGFSLVERGNNRQSGGAQFWFMEPLATTWGLKAAGLFRLAIDPDCRCRGMATCLLSKAMTDFRRQGIAIVEAQTMSENEPALALYRKLGFVEVDYGSVYRKDG